MASKNLMRSLHATQNMMDIFGPEKKNLSEFSFFSNLVMNNFCFPPILLNRGGKPTAVALCDRVYQPSVLGVNITCKKGSNEKKCVANPSL